MSQKPVEIENAEIAWLFREMAELLAQQPTVNKFRIRAYRTAARTIEHHPESLAEMVRTGTPLTTLPGVGNELAARINEILATGTFEALEKARGELPNGIHELVKLRGLGSKRAAALVKTLGIKSRDELATAIREGRTRTVPGFGPGVEAKLLRELERAPQELARFGRATVIEYGRALVKYLESSPEVIRCELAGSFRRLRDTVGNFDLVASGAVPSLVVERFTRYPGLISARADGPTTASGSLRNDLAVRLLVVDDRAFGAALIERTGSPAHVQALRERAAGRGLDLRSDGLFRGSQRIAGDTEEEVYADLALPWITPELRENRGEIEAGERGRLPRLVELSDVRGDLQSHTTASDGRSDLETVARAAEARGLAYLAITDHSPALKMVQGLDAAGFREQGREIEILNRSLGGLTVLRAAEVDILADGSLDLDDDILAELEVVVASVHSRFDLDRDAQTARLTRAVSHPSVDILGHPTGRIIGKRPPMEFDVRAVLEAARANGVMVEVNAQPDRLDFDDLIVRQAIDLGLKIVISTDAHRLPEFSFLHFGVEQARRGWATPADVANTLPLEDFRKLLHATRRSGANDLLERAPGSGKGE